MKATELREFLSRKPFDSLRLHLTSGETVEIRDPCSVAVMKSRMFVTTSGTDRWRFLALRDIVAVSRKNDLDCPSG